MHLFVSSLRATHSLLLCLAGLVLFTLVLSACDQVDATQQAEIDPLGINLDPLARTGVDEWKWVGPRGPNPMPGDFQDLGMMCRDSSATGFGFRRGSNRNILIFLMGGGACFNDENCFSNPSNFSEETFFNDLVNGTGDKNGESGLFSSTNPDNPFLNWTAIFVPYCTGDLHSGDTTNAVVSGVPTPQQFVGYRNMEIVLDILANRGARAANNIVLTGTSAGGFGTINTYGLVADRLAPAPVNLLNDSGPFLSADSAFSPDQEALWRSLWNMESRRITPSVIPEDCVECLNGLEYVLPYYAQTNPARTFAFTSYTEDCVDRSFLCKNNPFCTTTDLTCDGSTDLRIDAQVYEDALFDYRDSLLTNFITFYPEGNGHTFIQQSDFYEVQVDTLPLTDWIYNSFGGNSTDMPAQQDTTSGGP